MRHKEVHAINVPSSLKYVLDWGMTLISDKIKKRVKVNLFMVNMIRSTFIFILV